MTVLRVVLVSFMIGFDASVKTESGFGVELVFCYDFKQSGDCRQSKSKDLVTGLDRKSVV